MFEQSKPSKWNDERIEEDETVAKFFNSRFDKDAILERKKRELQRLQEEGKLAQQEREIRARMEKINTSDPERPNDQSEDDEEIELLRDMPSARNRQRQSH